MLVIRTWPPSNSQLRVGLLSSAFLLDMESNLSMTSVGVSTTDSEVFAPGHSEWVYPGQEVKRILVELFKDISQVKSICARFGSEGITLWTLLESYDREARDKVYEKELEACRMLHIYDFDFRVTSIDLVSPEGLVRTGSHQIYSRQ